MLLNITKSVRLPFLVLAGSVLVILGVVAGCQTAANPQQTEAQASSKVVAKGGAQLWAENCMRCHNIRDPKSYSDAQWSVAMRHMRMRANLTANEHDKILKFLQAGNN